MAAGKINVSPQLQLQILGKSVSSLRKIVRANEANCLATHCATTVLRELIMESIQGEDAQKKFMDRFDAKYKETHKQLQEQIKKATEKVKKDSKKANTILSAAGTPIGV